MGPQALPTLFLELLSDFQSTKAFSFHNWLTLNFAYIKIGDNILHNRTMLDFQLKS